MCGSERSERAWKIYKFSLVYFIYHYTQCVKWYNQNLWGPLFVGAPGQLPTLNSPKSGPAPDNYPPDNHPLGLLPPRTITP